MLECDEDLYKTAVELVLDGEGVGRLPDGSILQSMAIAISSSPFSSFFARHSSIRRTIGFEFLESTTASNEQKDGPEFPIARSCARLVEAYVNAANRPIEDWETSIDHWDQIVSTGIREFGERKRFIEIANLAAGVRNRDDKCQDSPNLFDSDRSIVRRARYARLRAGSKKWWSHQLKSAETPGEVRMAILVFATWAGPKTVLALASDFDKLVATLNGQDWRYIYKSARNTIRVNSGRHWIKPIAIDASTLPKSLNVRTVSLIAMRCTQATVDNLCERFLIGYDDDDTAANEILTEYLLRRALKSRADTAWSIALSQVSKNYALGAKASNSLRRIQQHTKILPEKFAREVANLPHEFPAVLVRAAEARCRQIDAKHIVPVGRVAADERWFDN